MAVSPLRRDSIDRSRNLCGYRFPARTCCECPIGPERTGTASRGGRFFPVWIVLEHFQSSLSSPSLNLNLITSSSSKKKKKKKKKTFQTAPVNAVTFDELQGLTYLQVKGSGIANTCPVIEEGTSDLKAVKAGNYKIEKFCMEPTSFTVKEESAFKGGEPEFVKTRLMTRLTYTLDEISGQFKVDGSGNGELNWLFLPFLGGKEQGRGARARWFFLVVFSSFEVSRKRGENSHPSLFPLSL